MSALIVFIIFGLFGATIAHCGSEQDSASKLGYTQVSWDNESGKEPQPASTNKSWNQLTDLERMGAERLGYTRDMWDNGNGEPGAAKKSWSELTACGPMECKKAAEKLGYTKTSWDNESGNEKQPSSGDKDWSDLTVEEMAAAETLGYTRKMWDGGKDPASMEMSWEQLGACAPFKTIPCQEAAQALGYTKNSWDNESGKEKQPSSSDKGWDELTALETAAAETLGYTRKMWDEGKDPPSMDISWDQLKTCAPFEPKSCREAAETLGYTKTSWDNKSGNEKQPSSGDKGWDELTEAEMAAAETLGYTRKMWDGGKDPPSMEMSWKQLKTCALFKPQSADELKNALKECHIK